MPSAALRAPNPAAAARPRRPWRAVGWALVLCAVGGLAFAQRGNDRTRPFTVEADAGRYDDARQSGTFTGHVVVTQGTLVLRAAQVEVRQAADGSASAVASGSAAEPARFRQQRQGLDEVLEGEALRIEYDGRTDTLRFVDQAVLRRWRGGELADEASGGLITFDNAASVYSVVGGAPGSGGRVRATISPRGAGSAPPSGGR
jgi:lipopolysaccharide export system protein LptA